MALFDQPHQSLRSWIAKSPESLERFTAFETEVRGKLAAWPNESADLATGTIMAAWARVAAQQGLIEISSSDIRRVAALGTLCRARMTKAERAWVKQLISHLFTESSWAGRSLLTATVAAGETD